MGDDFVRNVFCEAGEAIGNVQRRVFGFRRRGREAEAALRRWLDQVPAPVISPSPQRVRHAAEGQIVETTWRVIEDGEAPPQHEDEGGPQ
jgi:hypothetical protein